MDYNEKKTEKGDHSVMGFKNFIKVSWVIYFLNTICDPNIITLVQAVLEIFCSHASIIGL